MAKQLAEIKALFNKRFGYRETNWQKEKVQALGGLELDGLYLDGEPRLLWGESASVSKPFLNKKLDELKVEYSGLRFWLLIQESTLFILELKREQDFQKWWFVDIAELSVKESKKPKHKKLFERLSLEAMFVAAKSKREDYSKVIKQLVERFVKDNATASGFGDEKFLTVWEPPLGQKPTNDLIISFWKDLRKPNPNQFPIWHCRWESNGSFKFVFESTEGNVEERKFAEALANKLGLPPNAPHQNRWAKVYVRRDSSRSVQKVIESFVANDKVEIDRMLSNYLLRRQNNQQGENFSIGLLTQDDFDKTIKVYLGEVSKTNDKVEPESTYRELSLSSVELNNIGHFKKVSIDLSHRVTCFVGENGSGKSTILRAIALALLGADRTEKLAKANGQAKLATFLRIDSYDEQRNRAVYAEEGRIRLRVNEHHSKNYNKVAIRHENVIYFDGRDEKPRAENEILNEDGIASFRLLDHENHFYQPIIGFTQGRTNDLDDKSVELFTEEELLVRRQSGAHDLENLILDDSDERLRDFRDWLIDLSLTDDSSSGDAKQRFNEIPLEVREEIRGDALKILGGLIDKDIAHLYATSGTSVTQEYWIKVKPKGADDSSYDDIPFKLLSQGFKSVFSWVGQIIKRMAEHYDYEPGFLRKPGIILIDEIDLFLHPKWQRNILANLVEELPHCQFVVTTHSPFVVNNIDPRVMNQKDLLIHIIGKDQLLVQRDPIQGAVIHDIFDDLMGMPKYPDFTQEKIDVVSKYIDEEDIEKAEKALDDLKKILPPTDPFIVRATMNINFM